MATRVPGASGRAGLDRQSVVAAAAAIADAQGIEFVTLAGLADHLGIRTPSLYNHVASLAALRHELALLALTDLTARMRDALGDQSGEPGLLAFAHAYRAYAHAHPGLYTAVSRGAGPAADPALAAAGQALVDLALDVLRGFGLAGPDALHAVRGLRSLVHGFVSLELIGGFGLPLSLDASFAALIDTFTAGLRAHAPTTCEVPSDPATPIP